MISPDNFFDMRLKGKNEQQVLKVIDDLRGRINQLKLEMENPADQGFVVAHPSPWVRLSCTGLYLVKAKEALAALGALYPATEEELRAESFQENIPLIRKVVFGSGGYFGDAFNHIAILDGDSLIYDYEYLREPREKTLPKAGERPGTAKEFLTALSSLNIGEWLDNYSTERFGFTVCDGSSWWLEIEYEGGKESFRSGGCSAYPYNFAELECLFGVEGQLGNDQES